MIQINYKRIAEIQIIHEYFLLKPNGSSYYDLPNPEQKYAFLQERQLGNLYNLQNLLSLEATEETAKTLAAYKMKMVPTATGCIIGIMVDPIRLGETEREFQPFIVPPEGLKLAFSIKPKHALFRTITNTPLRSNLASIYHFTNVDEENVKTFPALSLPVEEVQEEISYPMGSIAKFGADDVREALQPTDSTTSSTWKKIASAQYVHEQDRLLLPHIFAYRFDTNIEVLKAEFILKRVGGGRVKKIIKEDTKPLTLVRLDYSNTSNDPGDPGEEILSGIYQLDIKGVDVTFFASYMIFLDSTIYDSQAVGVIELQISKGNTAFDLLRPNGNLRTKIDADSTHITVVPHPTFQLLFKSRNTYWRYISARKRGLTVGTKADPFLRPENGNLVTKNPRNLTHTPARFMENDPPSTGVNGISLPNPTPGTLSVEDGHFFSNVYVTTIKDVINES